MDDVSTTHGHATRAFVRHVVDLTDLHGRDIPVLFERNLDLLDLAPPIRRTGFHEEYFAPHDQVGLDRPLARVVELQRRRHIGRITLGSSGVRPRRDRRYLIIAQRHVVLELLDPDVLFHIPRRHGPGAVSQSRSVFDERSPRTRRLVRLQRQRSPTSGPVTVHTFLLENRSDISRECHFCDLYAPARRREPLLRTQLERAERHERCEKQRPSGHTAQGPSPLTRHGIPPGMKH